ncbi:hypothetical protein Pint_27372 [Pistacia integerrima]|uniref:Uncharacterized protein n=1 Tax=Pistacia integerrima TaxID=434235 RepID=A0ACC0YUW8_9ROSI|nr:hypothetical protein Pint_27372 [Pistacia integerrima]
MARHKLVEQIVGDLSFTNSSSFSKLLDSCLRSKSLRDTGRIHARIIKSHFSSEIYIQNRLIDVYAKCGHLDDARKVFDKMPHRNVFTWNSIVTALLKWGFVDDASRIFGLMPQRDQCSWNSMISGFAQHDRFDEALEYFVKMHRENFVLNEYSFGSALSACAGLMDLKMGTQIHGLLEKSRYSSDIYMGSALVDMYGKCGRVGCAQLVFDGMRERNMVSWNSLITCYEQNGPASEALEIFVRMMDCGIEWDEVTLASVVSACASLAAIKEGYTQNGENEEALGLFCLLKREAVCPTHYTFGNLLNACANVADLQLGRQAHTHVLKHGFRFQSGDEPDIFVGNSLIDMYLKCGSVEDGFRIFETMVERDWVSWNAMIMKRVGYVPNTGDYDASGEEDISKSASHCQTNLPIDAGIDSGPQCGGKNLALRYCVLIKKPTYNLQILGPTDLSLKRTKHSNATGEHLDLLASFLAS